MSQWPCGDCPPCASQASGLSEWMGKQMEPLHTVSPTAITLIMSSLIAVLTECTSNVATTTLFLPIFASMVSNSAGGESSFQRKLTGSLERQ